LGILIEQMRREGYEMCVSPPQIVTKICPDDPKKVLEPFEEVVIDVDAEYAGTVIDSLTGGRKGNLMEMHDDSDGKTRLVFEMPSRSLLGFTSEMATSTRGTAVMHHYYVGDREWAGEISKGGGGGGERGKMVSNASGKATTFALSNLSERGTLLVETGDDIYPGMVVGESSRGSDMEVNPVKAKETNNMRTQSKEERLILSPPKRYTVEELIGLMADDEIIEVTPKSVRLRKAELDAGIRVRAAKARKKRLDAQNSNNNSSNNGAGNKKKGKRG